MSWTRIRYLDVDFYTPISYGNRTHKLCQLPNGILVLLISDPTESAIGCSLTVATGSHSDPVDAPGLAHLCEHMILAGGSKKYPSLGLYHDMIAKNNGSHNAFTTGDQTTFFFELPDFHKSAEANFEKVVDIFASFFVEPLFDRASIDKEIYAIQNEHDSNVSNTMKILYHATRLLSSESHPFNRFATGSMSTLKKRTQVKGLNLRTSLLRFFKHNYHSSRMTLCIRGPQSVHGLAKLAISRFNDIQSSCDKDLLLTPGQGIGILRNASILRDSRTLCCFPDDSSCNSILINSARQPIIRFLFPVRQRNTIFTSKDFAIYAQFWVELLGDEAPGSLSYYLSAKGWITACYAFSSDFSLDNSGLILELSLTNSGWQNIEFIVQLIAFSLIPTFSRRNTIHLARFLSEQFSIDLMKFLFSTAENSPMEECSQISGSLQKDFQAVDIPYIFKASPMLMIRDSAVGLFDEDRNSQEWWIGQSIKFQRYLKDFMDLSKMRMIFLGPLEKCSMLDSTLLCGCPVIDQFYLFEYYKCKLSIDRPQYDVISPDTFHIPFENPYRPDFGKKFCSILHKIDEASTKSKQASLALTVKRNQSSELPHLVSQNEKYEMWVLEESLNLHGQSLVTFDLSSPQIEPSPENTINLEVLAQIISMTLSSCIYPAVKLGFSLQIFPSLKGDVCLRFTISGYAESIVQIVHEAIDVINRIVKDASFPSRQLLRSARVSVRKKYESAATENSTKLAGLGLLIVMERHMWTLEERIEAIENTDIVSFKEFNSEFARGSIYLTLFIQGDISCADAINCCLDRELTCHLRSSLGERPEKQEIPSTKILDRGTNVFFEYAGQADDPTNSIVYFIQTGPRNDKEIYTLTALCEYIMSFTLVPELRNNRQIGYVVLGGLRLLCDTVGLHVTIMSGASSSVLEDSINGYLHYLEMEILSSMPEHTFRKEIVGSFLQLLEKNCFDKLERFSGPASLLDELAANIEHGDPSILQSCSMKRHKKCVNQILAGHHKFTKCYRPIDSNLLQRLSLKQFMTFFLEKISIHSKTRCKISIMVGSPLSEEQITNRRIFLQLQSLFRLRGLVIEPDKLREVVEGTNGRPTLLAKELYQYFHNRRDTWRLCALIIRETFRVLAMNLRFKHDQQGATTIADRAHTPAVELNHIRDINIYKKEFATTQNLPI